VLRSTLMSVYLFDNLHTTVIKAYLIPPRERYFSNYLLMTHKRGCIVSLVVRGPAVSIETNKQQLTPLLRVSYETAGHRWTLRAANTSFPFETGSRKQSRGDIAHRAP
jgi:hypothetical protein